MPGCARALRPLRTIVPGGPGKPRLAGLVVPMVHAAIGDLELECRTLRRVEQLNMAAVHTDDLRGDGEAETRPAFTLRPGKRFKKMIARLLRDPGAGVAHLNEHAP